MISGIGSSLPQAMNSSTIMMILYLTDEYNVYSKETKDSYYFGLGCDLNKTPHRMFYLSLFYGERTHMNKSALQAPDTSAFRYTSV